MKCPFAFALVLFVALRLAAQDVIISGPSWVDPSDPPDQLPVVRMYTPDYPKRLNGSTEIGYLAIDWFVFAKGSSPITERYVDTNPLFFDAFKEAGDWEAKPAKREGKSVNSFVRYGFIFNPACASATTPDATPRLLSVVVPELPDGSADKKEEPLLLHVTATVDVSGQVTKAVADAGAPEALGQVAEEAVLKWKFAPARKKGQPVVQNVRVPVVFLRLSNANDEADTPPRVTYEAPQLYPLAMQRAGLRGVVTVRFVVDIEGRVRDPVVLSSTNPVFNQTAIDWAMKWRFEPGRRNGIPVNTHMEMPFTFDRSESSEGKEAYDVSNGDQSKLPPGLRYDIPPKPANVVFAVYPFELLRDGVSGTAEVQFLINPSGEVAQAVVIKATRPEFGQALVAMLDEWRFQPAMKEGNPTLAALDIQQEFSDSGGDVPVSDEARDLLDELKKKKPDLCPLKELDVRPLLLSQRSPVFPSALIGKVAGGQAVVEFLIDHYGNVQLPRVVSATDPAFGYAAVQGVAAWRFAPLTSHGKSVAARAKVPIEFVTPKPAAQN